MADMTSEPMQLVAHPDRTRGDMCPGALTLHHAADGAIGRIRFPGGRVRSQDWAEIAAISKELGDATVHITTRGNMQFRGVSDEQAFGERVEAAGFLPSRAHDKIRNILASPLSPNLWQFSEALDNALLANDVVAGLSGRTLFGFDNGSGDILSQRPDFGVQHTPDGFDLMLGGKDSGMRLRNPNEVVPMMVSAAQLWQEMRQRTWRLQENAEVRARIVDKLQAEFDLQPHDRTLTIHEGSARPVGWIQEGDTVALGAGLRFGFLSAKAAELLAIIGADTAITPWASLVIHGLSEGDAEAVVRVMAPQGLIFDANSPWLKVTACTGLPGCEKSLSNTQADAKALVSSGEAIEGLVHFSGCDRRCGHPLSAHTEYVATGDGEYEVAQR
ncbi:precorrin-3B synthase [Corynebacterium pseudopelargi]|uniref:Ferredoxin-nitrite reductase n=1 Tax=Corynebacterium pseudopelargi TaxID=2080757 RepID=A0A3G6IUM2_9CORY|nr:precorrin-3B synthase [Corynebacterium pseudopelargi]AZA09287.1 ferredoxin-nitrite reductase [Corynebacterium pseudopelargi]